MTKLKPIIEPPKTKHTTNDAKRASVLLGKLVNHTDDRRSAARKSTI